MKAWRRSGGLGPPAAAPAAPLTLVSAGVESDPSTDVLWTFSGVVTVSGNSPQLQVQEGAGEFQGPLACIAEDAFRVRATYNFDVSQGYSWRVLSQPAGVVQTVTVPVSGVIGPG